MILGHALGFCLIIILIYELHHLPSFIILFIMEFTILLDQQILIPCTCTFFSLFRNWTALNYQHPQTPHMEFYDKAHRMKFHKWSEWDKAPAVNPNLKQQFSWQQNNKHENKQKTTSSTNLDWHIPVGQCDFQILEKGGKEFQPILEHFIVTYCISIVLSSMSYYFENNKILFYKKEEF